MKQLVALIPETDEEKANHNSTHAFVNADGGITDAGEVLVLLAFEVLGKACFLNSKAHGWYEDYMKDVTAEGGTEGREVLTERNFGEVIGLIHSEVSEALEAYRDGDVPQEISYSYKITMEDGEVRTGMDERSEIDGTLGKPEGVASEFADTIIRIADYQGAYGVPLGQAIIEKHRYNFTRAYRHGGKKA